MTEDFLTARTRKELTVLARRHRVGGWHSMKKADLVQAILTARHRRVADCAERNPRRRLAVAVPEAAFPRGQDRISAEAVDSSWIHVRWEISRGGVRRAEAALKAAWHQAVPVLRVFDVTPDEHASATRRLIAQIEIHAETDHWFVPVADPPRSYEVEIGYRTPAGRFHSLARSRRVRTARPGSRACASNGRDNGHVASTPARAAAHAPCRALPRPSCAGSANGAAGRHGDGEFEFTLDAEIIIHGMTHPHAETTLLGEPVHPNPDGSFTLHLSLPNGRQVIPAVAVAPDGSAQRTIILSVDRNTRELEPLPLGEEF
ncbi:MAG: DUF4912 domain-containing protein [Planctomycetales bacterium]